MFKKLPITKDEPVESFFPLSYEGFKLTVRHGGDPLIAAINLTPKRGTFQFGDTSKTIFMQGLMMILISSIALLILITYTVLNILKSIKKKPVKTQKAKLTRHEK